MKSIASLLLPLFLFLGGFVAEAKEQTFELVRQSRTMAMGGAGVGLADDEYALFQNAAGLAGSEIRGFRLVGANLEGSWDAYTNMFDILALSGNFTLSSLNTFMGKDIALRMSEVPMIFLPHFSLAYVVDGQFTLNEFNKVNPNINLGYMVTHGVQGGTAWSFKQGRHPTEEFRVGVALKLLFRRGGYYDIGSSGLLQATNGGPTYINSIVGNYGVGFGGDLGVQYIKKLNPTDTFSFGSSLTDVGNTKFSEPRAMTIPMVWNFGLGYKKMLQETKLSFGLDMRNILLSTAFSNKIHFGAEADLGFLTLQAGLNQLNPTYGVGFDAWMFKLMFLSYAEELGPSYHQLSSRRAMIQANFNMPI